MNVFNNIFNSPVLGAIGIGVFGQSVSVDQCSFFSNAFSDFNSGTGIYIQSSGGTITSASVSSNSFSGLTNGSDGILFNTTLGGTITSATVSGNVINGISSNSKGLNALLNTSSSIFLGVTDNSFIGDGGIANGFAATIDLSGTGTLCLDFRGNNATPVIPVPPPYAYVFTRTGGTFNRTAGSGPNSTSGQFFIGPGVNTSTPATCP